jgi:hypothetical protein
MTRLHCPVLCFVPRQPHVSSCQQSVTFRLARLFENPGGRDGYGGNTQPLEHALLGYLRRCRVILVGADRRYEKRKLPRTCLTDTCPPSNSALFLRGLRRWSRHRFSGTPVAGGDTVRGAVM